MYELTYDAAIHVLHDYPHLTVADVVDNYGHWCVRVAEAAARIRDLGHDLTFLATVADEAYDALVDAVAEVDAQDFAAAAMDDGYLARTSALVWTLVRNDAAIALSDAAQVAALLPTRP